MTVLGQMSSVRNETPSGFDWSRYGMGPAFGFWGNLQPPTPSSPGDVTQQAAREAAAKLLQSTQPQTSAGDGSGYSGSNAPATGDPGAPYGGSLAPSNLGATIGGIGGSALGMALGVPGIGLAGTGLGSAYDVSKANDTLQGLGIPGLDYGKAIASAMSMDLLGTSLSDQFNSAVTAQYPGLLAAMTPAPPVATPATAPASTPSMDFFSAINDYNTVGRLGEVLNGQDTGGAGTERGGGNESGSTGDPNSAGGGGAGNQGDGRDGPPGSWHSGGPVGAATGKSREVRAKLKTDEFVMKGKARRKYGDRAMSAINKGRIPAKRLRALV